MATVIEQYLYGKHGSETLDEDGLFIGRTFMAVVDGVTSKSTMNLWNPTPGVVAKNTVIETIATMDVETDTGVSAETFLHDDPEQDGTSEAAWGMRATQRRIDNALRARYRNHQTHSEQFFATHPTEQLQANAVIYSDAAHEIWLFGDCQTMINGQRIPSMKKSTNSYPPYAASSGKHTNSTATNPQTAPTQAAPPSCRSSACKQHSPTNTANTATSSSTATPTPNTPYAHSTSTPATT